MNDTTTVVREETKTSDNSYLFSGGAGWTTITIPAANLKIDYAPKSSQNVVAIIPARGNSKSIPRKNMRLFRGKPLVQHTIEASLNANLVTKTVVTTEDKEIASLASGLGVQRVINRPAYLSQDHVQMEETVLQAFRELEFVDREKIDILVVLPPTSPLRTGDDIDAAVALFLSDDNKENGPVISGCVDSRYHWQEEGLHHWAYPIGHDPKERLGRQWNKSIPMRVENGALYVIDALKFSLRRTFWYNTPLFYVMSQKNEIELDTEANWNVLERGDNL